MAKNETTVTDDFGDEDKVQSLQINLWDYKENKEIVGIVTEVSEGNFNGKKIGLQTETSEEIVYLPELSALNSKLKNVVVSDKIKLVYLGQEKAKSSGRYYETFDVYIKSQ